jgi:predicted Rossmann fold nucleotide-binding protein DprA/Smf involved in DNA uptake
MMRNRLDLQELATCGGRANALGAPTLFERRKLALLCSRNCPGDAILNTYDFARLVRDSGIAIVSGFHSPIEKDCLPILLRGRGPIIICQGRRLSTTRLPAEWQKAIDVGRLLLLSPFAGKSKRVTTELAVERNRFAAAISEEVLIPYAAPGSKTETLALELLSSGKRVYTFSDRPGPLRAASAVVINPDFFSAMPQSGNSALGTS